MTTGLDRHPRRYNARSRPDPRTPLGRDPRPRTASVPERPRPGRIRPEYGLSAREPRFRGRGGLRPTLEGHTIPARLRPVAIRVPARLGVREDAPGRRLRPHARPAGRAAWVPAGRRAG